MRWLAIASVILVLGVLAGTAAAEEEGSPGVPRSVTDAVGRFVEVKGDPTEKTMARYSQFLAALPKAEGGCNARPEARAAVSRVWVGEAETQIHDVLYVEKGELTLYKDAKKITDRRIRQRFVVALDQVGNGLDRQLGDAKFDLRIARKVAGDCSKLEQGTLAADEWTEATKQVREALGNLVLAYAV